MFSNYVSQLCILNTTFFLYLRIYRKYTSELNAHNQHFISSETLLKYIARITNDYQQKQTLSKSLNPSDHKRIPYFYESEDLFSTLLTCYWWCTYSEKIVLEYLFLNVVFIPLIKLLRVSLLCFISFKDSAW